MDRIEMNGVWYVKETPTQEIEWDPTCFNGRVYESDLYCFEATQILKDDGTPYKKGCDIEITNKREKPWKTEHIDNPLWYIRVLENHPESMEDANEMFCEQGLNEFKSVIEDLIHIGWINK
jgi:hypothetical protein